MATSESTSDRGLLHRLRTCPYCGAHTPSHITHCWVCQEDLRKADAGSLKTNQFSIQTFFLATTLLAVTLAVFRFSAVAGFILLALVIPATTRTIWTAQIWKASRDRMPLGTLLDTFLGSLGVSLAAWVFGILAFVFCCTCAGMLDAPLLLPIAVVCGLATAGYWFWTMRPRD